MLFGLFEKMLYAIINENTATAAETATVRPETLLFQNR
jgi:hypothetical protein